MHRDSCASTVLLDSCLESCTSPKSLRASLAAKPCPKGEYRIGWVYWEKDNARAKHCWTRVVAVSTDSTLTLYQGMSRTSDTYPVGLLLQVHVKYVNLDDQKIIVIGVDRKIVTLWISDVVECELWTTRLQTAQRMTKNRLQHEDVIELQDEFTIHEHPHLDRYRSTFKRFTRMCRRKLTGKK